MRGEAFWGLKNPENPGASGGSAPWTPPGRCPWTPPGALERAPGPHAVKTLRSLRSLRSTWTQTIFFQHPAVTNPAHAHALYCTFILPYINYGILIWGNTCKVYLDKLIKLQKWAIRKISNSHYRSHT